MSTQVLTLRRRVSVWSETKQARISLNRLLWFAFAAVFILVGRIPSIIAPPIDIDEGLYATAGQAIARGGLIYRDVWDNKPPAIYFLYSWISQLNSDYVAFRIVATVFLIASAAVIYLIALRSLSSQTRWSLAVFSFLATVPILETHTSNAEIFFLLPTSLAILLTMLIEWHHWSRRYYLLVGACLGLGLLFKAVVAFDAMAILCLLAFRYGSALLKRLRDIALGALVVFAIPAYYLTSNGLWGEFVRAALLDNVGYVREGNVGVAESSPWLAIVLKLSLLIVSIVVIYRSQRPEFKPTALLYLWFVWTVFGAVLSGRPYLHYLIAAMGALSLLIPIAWQSIWPPLRWRSLHWHVLAKGFALAGALIGVLVLGFGGIVHFVSSTPELTRVAKGYYGNAQRYLSGQITRDEYLDFYGETITLNLQTAEYLRQNSRPDARAFIWGNAPWIYYLSERSPATRYLFASHATFVRDAEKEILADLTGSPPDFVIFTNEPRMFAEAGAPTPAFPQLNQFVHDRYQFKVNFGRIEIYQLVSSAQIAHITAGGTWSIP